VLTALVICRLLHDGAALGLFGASAYVALLVPAGLAPALGRAMTRIGLAAVPLVGLTTLLWLALEAGQFGEGWSDTVRPATLAAVLFDTAFGHAWQAQAILALLLVAGFAVGGARRTGVAAGLSGLILVDLAFMGHPIMRSGAAGGWLRASFALHLLAGGFWLGSLGPLLVVIGRLRNGADRPDAILALRRFSVAGHAAVTLVVLTGVTDLMLIRGAAMPAALPPYLVVLGGKVGLVAAMIGIAVHNRYRLVPAMGRTDAAGTAFRRNTVLELAIGAVVLALAALLGTLEPG
jgi:putative copper resistance protein D